MTDILLQEIHEEDEELLDELQDACREADLTKLTLLLEGKSLHNVKFIDVFNKQSSPIHETLKAYGVSFEQKMAAIKLLLRKGNKPNLRQELGENIEQYLFFVEIIEDYLQEPIPEKLDLLIDNKLKLEWDKCVNPIIKAIESAAKKTDKKHDGFKLRITSGRIYIESMNHGVHDDIVKKVVNKTLYCMQDNDAIAALPDRIQSGVQKLVDKKIFEPIMSNETFPIIIFNGYDNSHHLAKQVTIITIHNSTVLDNVHNAWPKRLADFMQMSNKLPSLADIASTLFFGKGVTSPAPEQAIDLVFAELYKSTTLEQEREIKALLWEFQQHKDFYIDIHYRLGIYYKDIGNNYVAIDYLKDIKTYPLAQQALDLLGYQEQKIPLTIEEYTDNDLNFNNTNITAEASKQGTVTLKFNIENRDAYSDALNFINNLMDKGYSKLFSGYRLDVAFVNKPRYLNVKNFPEVPVHAFFVKAVSYPLLHSKIRQYAKLTLETYDWYHDINDEDCAGTGTFAACALAMRKIDHLDLLSLLANEAAGEYQEIQINMIPAIIKRYGVTPTTIPAIFDLAVSYGQYYAINLPPELYTEQANLTAVVQYSEQFSDSKVGYFIDHWFNLDNIEQTFARLQELASSAKGDMVKMYNILIKKYKKYQTQLN